MDITEFLQTMLKVLGNGTLSVFFAVAVVSVIFFAAPDLLRYWSRLLVSFLSKDSPNLRDTLEREASSRIQLSERQVFDRLKTQVEKRIEEHLQSDDFLKKVVQAKLDDTLIEEVDAALSARVHVEATKLKALDHLKLTLDSNKKNLEGPASRAEAAAAVSRRLAYLFAIAGVLVAGLRLYVVNDAQVAGDIHWPTVALRSGPWVGLILLIEFTALLFFKFYGRSIELQRYFTRELSVIENQFAALQVTIDLGGPSDAVRSATAMLKAGEPNVFQDEKAEDLNSLTNALTDLAGLIKKVKPGAE
ncbi:hypothetical protein [Rhizobium sp. Root708]|uniref:hypothetical protein n=1 Tax=Rhizobium sp. Root708 TaxID=1736592 RepID=UPI000AFD5FC8|nr:hypothetical protein [Rhizobium sp. Root708]